MALYVTITRGVTADADTIIDAQFLNLLGQPIVEIRGTLDGEGAVSISDGSITTQKLADASGADSGVTNPKAAWVPAYSLKGNSTNLVSAPQDLTVAQAQSLLSVQADDATLEHYDNSGGYIRVKDAGITAAKLGPAAVTSPKLDLRPPTLITANTATLTVAENLLFNIEPTSDATYTLAWAAADEGKSVLVRVKSPGDYNLEFAVSGEIALSLRWRLAEAITPTEVAGKVDLVLFTRIGANVYASPIYGFEG